MLPRVILHNGISVDGRYDWYTGDVGLYYELAGRLESDAMLSGSNTVLAAFASAEAPGQAGDAAGPPQSDPADRRPWLVFVDSRGQVKNLPQIRRQPYWRDVITLCSLATPPAHRAYLAEQQVEHIVAGDDRVDLAAALAELKARYGLNRLRVDSGGILNGALLRQGLVDEVSVVLNPALVGGTSPRSFFTAPDLASTEGVIPLRLVHLEQVGDGAVWLRYEVVKKAAI
jgi:2,5-diamino-6-(ribosylamino)-4(3H)-pyrimidinone 5'-phosphate reductase